MIARRQTASATTSISTRLLPRASILAAALLFSTGGTAIKATALSGFQVAGARSAIAALVLVAVLPTWRGWWRPRPLLVGLAYGLTMVGFVVANKLTLAANAIFLQSTAPLYILVLAPLLLGERNRRADIVLTGVLFAGLALFFVGAESPGQTAPRPGLGNQVGVGIGVTFACALVGLRWLARHATNREQDGAGAAVVAGNIIAFAMCLPFAWPVAPSVGLVDLAVVSWLGIFQIGLAYVLLTRGMRQVPALETSLLGLVEPVLSGFWAFAILDELPGGWSLAGCAVILTATATRILLRTAGRF